MSADRSAAHAAFHRLGADAVGWWKPSRELNFTRLDGSVEAGMQAHDNAAMRGAESVFVSGWVEALAHRGEVEYLLVECSYAVDLGRSVQELLREGWHLHGSPLVSADDDGRATYAQAVTRGVP